MIDKPTVDQDNVSSEKSDLEWVSDVLGQHMDQRVENLDFTVTSKLSAARRRALSANDNRFRLPVWQRLGAVTAVASILTLVGLYVYQSGSPQLQQPAIVQQDSSGSLIEDLPLLSSSDDLQFFQTLELLEWMENNQG